VASIGPPPLVRRWWPASSCPLFISQVWADAILIRREGFRWQVRSSQNAYTRRFPLPWTVEELDACFIVTDSAGQKLAYVYFEEEAGRRAAAKLVTRDEAHRIALDFAKLPELSQKP
jgi:hypothetical protein